MKVWCFELPLMAPKSRKIVLFAMKFSKKMSAEMA
jgi:hypothetical protein